MLTSEIKYFLLCFLLIFSFNTGVAHAAPQCSAAAIAEDTGQWGDSDGWGFENGQSCMYDVNGNNNNAGNTGNNSSSNTANNSGTPQCSAAAIAEDTGQWGDSDGWGFENGQSCMYDVNGNNNNTDNSGTNGNSFNFSDISDVILMAGQSNAAGEKSTINFNDSQDTSTSRVLVWDPDQGGDGSTGEWKVAEPCEQEWYVSGYHSNTFRYPSNNPVNGTCQNHPGFQIAKKIAAGNGGRTVALIATSIPGAGVSEWANNRPGRNEINAVVNGAYNNLIANGVSKNNAYIKYIAWAQGETDRQDNISLYTNYKPKFNQLISYLNGREWFKNSSGNNGIIVPQYISRKDAYCNSNGNPTVTNDPSYTNSVNESFDQLLSEQKIYGIVATHDTCAPDDGTHYNAATLRTLGQRHAAIFEGRY